MPSNFPPRREANLVIWSGIFGSKITLSPGAVGLNAGQCTTYNGYQSAFVNAYTIAQADATRSPMNVSLKNQAKANLIRNIRLLAGIIQKFPGTTNPMRMDLGLPVRGTSPTPIPAPSGAPLVEVKSVSGRTARLRLIDGANPTRRGMPPGTAGASVYSFVGASAPSEVSAWKFEGNTGVTRLDVTFPSTVANGATVWFLACWFNPRKENGPLSDAVSANVPGGSVSMAA